MMKDFLNLSCNEARDLNNKNIIYNPCILFINNCYYKIKTWDEVIKIFYYYAYLENIDYFNLFIEKDKKLDGKKCICNRELTPDFIKCQNNVYVRKYPSWSSNYILLYYFFKSIYKFDTNKIQIFFNDTELTDEFKDEFIIDFNNSISKRKPKVRNAKYLISKINNEIYTAKEKFIIKFEKAFDKKKILGDIYFNEEEIKLLNEYMKLELDKIVNNVTYTINHKKIFVLGLIQYAIKYYKSNSFWPGFKKEYGISIPSNKQTEINNQFEYILKSNGKVYDEDQPIKIENMCLHGFVCNNYSTKFFKYLFDFWKLDLKRIYENTNMVVQTSPKKTNFDILIDELLKSDGKFTSDIALHTSLAIKYFSNNCKLRIRKYLKTIDDCFWGNKELKYTHNRLNNELKDWIEKSKGDFIKELSKINNIAGGRNRGQKLLSSPTINVDFDSLTFKLFIPRQIFINFDETKAVNWHIYNNDHTFEKTIDAEIIMGKASYYSEEFEIELPSKYLFDSIHFDILYGNDLYAKFLIDKFNNRFFNNKGESVTTRYKDFNIYSGLLTTISPQGFEPRLLYSDKQEKSKENELIITDFDLENGDIIILYNDKAIQVGKKLEEGFIGNCVVEGTNTIINYENIKILNKLPKILFKCEKSLLNGCGLLINNKAYRLTDYKFNEIKFNDDINSPNGYFIDLNDFVSKTDFYDVIISIPKMHGNTEYKFLYIKDFKYEFLNSPYVFADYGELSLPKYLKFDYSSLKNNLIADEENNILSFLFNNKKDNCDFIKDGKLILNYLLNDKYIDIYFDIPVFYWQFDKVDEDNWKTKKPQNLVLKKIPNKLYVKGPFAFQEKSNKIYVDDYSILDDMDTEIYFTKDKNSNYYYCKIRDFYLWLNREETYRKLYLKLNNVDYELCDVVCKSIVLDKNIVGDFKNNCLHGYFDIQGDSDYYIDIYKGSTKIFEEINLIDGTFSLDYNLEKGNYKIVLFEVEKDDFDYSDSGFELASYNLKLVNILDLEDSKIYLKRICDKDSEVDSLYLSSKHVITNLYKIDNDYIQKKDYEFMFWRYDFADNLDELLYYKGILQFVDDYGKYHFISKVCVVFRNNYDIKNVVILKKNEELYQEMEYDLSNSYIIRDGNLIDKQYRYKHIITLDDDLFDFIIDIVDDNEEEK